MPNNAMKTDRLLRAVFRIDFFSDGLFFLNILGFNRLLLMAGVSRAMKIKLDNKTRFG